MSDLEYYLDFFSMPLLISALLIFTPFLWWDFFFGYVGWSLAEYIIHRWIFHALPWFEKPHEEHHHNPSGKTGVSSFQSLGIFLCPMIFVILGLISGSMLAGFTVGYLLYIVTHHNLHHYEIRPGDGMYGMKMRHRMHHKGEEVNFGVTTTLWDHVFRTYKPWKRVDSN